MAFTPARLFTAVVVSGAALAGCPREPEKAPIVPEPVADALPSEPMILEG
jgi:hypothetical protein